MVHLPDGTGGHRRYELAGPLRFLNHSCAPNAAIQAFELVALQPISAGHELTVDYGPKACNCRAQAPNLIESDVSHG
jgi:hypothetical protein